MKISTKGRYATRIMLYLAIHKGEAPARKQEISRAEGITPDYVEQLLIRLKTAGLVKSRRGVAGGFVIGKDPAAITLEDVVTAVEGSISIAPCIGGESCKRIAFCVTQNVWRKTNEAIIGVLSGTTLEDLAEEARKQTVSRAPHFDI